METESSARAVHTLNHCAIFLAHAKLPILQPEHSGIIIIPNLRGAEDEPGASCMHYRRSWLTLSSIMLL